MKAGTDHKENFMRRFKEGIRCPRCGDKLFSWFRHDYHPCSCGYCTIDGGWDYLHYGWEGKEKPGWVGRVWGSIPVWLNDFYIARDKEVKRFKFKGK